jgi:hypothetical protein
MKRVHSQTETIAFLCDQGVALDIPSYQRPYVWPPEDVTKLLDDIEQARASGQKRYYIGTLLTSRSDCNGHSAALTSYELIDGQQRATTLTLLALAFCKRLPNHPLSDMTQLGELPRLTFRIREEAQAFLAREAGLTPALELDDTALASPYLIHLRQGLKAACDRLKQLENHGCRLTELADYLYRNVVWVNNIVPHGTNLNRLFERINTGGVQLEQSDILKAQLLAKIADHRLKRQCDAIWQACENLNNYFERNARQLFPLANWHELEFDDLAQYDESRFPLEPATGIVPEINAATALTLAQLAEQATAGHYSNEGKVNPSKTDNSNRYCRSVIGFPLLLIHAYRIFRARMGEEDIECRVNATQLSKCFEGLVTKGDDKDAINFIHCLWRVRYQFDRWVVKWLQRGGDDAEHLYLGSVSLGLSESGKRLNRYYSEATPDLVQLQAVRNFTGERSAQYWLSPFLYRMMELRKPSQSDALGELEKIDNVLSLAVVTQKEASFALLCQKTVVCQPFEAVIAHLQQSLGTGFEHYWFQKLEYLLWKHRAKQPFMEEQRWYNFRITSKNSVEHVHPQHHKYQQEQLPVAIIDGFGNLVLLSPGENSSYSNMDPAQKRVDFERKRTYDSLKLSHIFYLMAQQPWSKELMEEHRDEMINQLASHYAEIDRNTEEAAA